jgi:signal transduction histidine kinase
MSSLPEPAVPAFRLPTERRGWLVVAAVAVLLGVSAVVENLAYPTGALTGYVWVSILVTALACVVAYPFPFLGLALALAFTVVSMLVPGMPHGGGTALITSLFLLGFLAYRLPGRWSLAAWLLAAAAPGTALLLTRGDAYEPLFYLLFLAPAWAVGVLLQRERRRTAELVRLSEELAAEREHRTETAISAERTRIARELHDAVAHSVSVMTLQVGVVRRRLDALPTEQETLSQAEQLGRRSVAELRRIVGLVRPSEPELAPLPSLDQLDDLVTQVRTAGADVALVRTGTPGPLPPVLDMSAYRIVQEGLTNALRHAPGAAVRVEMEQGADAVTVRITDEGRGAPAQVRPGNGLTGMAERVAFTGGRLTYGRTPAGGFRVEAVLPVPAADRVSEPVS